jgi:alkanesulfonate monooxygenase
VNVEVVGMIGTRDGSETRAAAGPPIDADYTRAFVRAHEDAGFDRVLVGYGSSSADSAQVAAFGAAHSERLGFLIAHRPGAMAPTLAARTFATLDVFAGGRIAVHVITGGSDAEQLRDGDDLGKDERYARTDEYLDVLKLSWTSEQPFDYDGRFYRVREALTPVRSPQRPRLPLYFGGSSDAAFRVGGKHADVFALWGEPLQETAEQIARVQEAARAAGRDDAPRISVSFRPILGATDDEAWERAYRLLGVAQERAAAGANLGVHYERSGTPANVGSQRLLALAERGELHDRCLWTPIAAATGAPGSSTALVGSPETVAEALLDYVRLGVTTLLIRGFDPYDDAVAYGRDLIPLVRQEAARLDR